MEYRITISPCPSRILNVAQKRSYAVMTTQEQYKAIITGVQLAMIETTHQHDVEISTKQYFEFNSSGMLHTHGTIRFSEKDDLIALTFRRMVMRHLGAVFFKGPPEKYLKAVCKLDDVEHPWDAAISEGKYKSWYEYCLKDQTERHLASYPPLVLETHSVENLKNILAITEEGTAEYKQIQKRIKHMNRVLSGLHRP